MTAKPITHSRQRATTHLLKCKILLRICPLACIYKAFLLDGPNYTTFPYIYTLKSCVSGHVLSVQNTEKEGVRAFSNVLGEQIIFH